MSVARLIDALKRLTEIYEAGGAASQAKELRVLVDALAPDAEMSVEDFVTQINAASAPKPKKPPKLAKAVDPEIIQRYVQSLKDAEDLDEVVAVISIIKHDKLDKGHVTQIAAQFIGGEPRFKSVSDAFSRIRGAFIEQKRFENKLKAAHLD